MSAEEKCGEEKLDNEDVEQQSGKKKEDDEELEKVKEKKHPGINASLVAFYLIYSSMFIVGWVTLNSCPLDIKIPIYLIVAGATGALTKFLSKIDNHHIFNLSLVTLAFYVVWHVYGSYCVYRVFQPNYNPKEGLYCNRVAYLFAFWMITMQYSLFVTFLLLSGCYLLMRNDFSVIM